MTRTTRTATIIIKILRSQANESVGERCLLCEPNGPSLIRGPHVKVQGENHLLKLSSDLHMYSTHVRTRTSHSNIRIIMLSTESGFELGITILQFPIHTPAIGG